MKKQVIIPIIAVLAAIVIGLLVWNLLQRREMTDLVEQMAIEKEELQEEYEDLAIQFDGYQQMNLNNDSLQAALGREQQRVHDLLEELKMTKASNAKEIGRLKKELATVREVMKDYVRQIDSLNACNARLTEENIMVKTENQQFRVANEELTAANTELSATVSRAAMLEMTACNLVTLNKRDKKTSIKSSITKLQFNYSIAKNVTAKPGIKNLYVRVIDPEGTMVNNSGRTFTFENSEQPYSVVHNFEYEGTAFNGTCYCPLDSEVKKGVYTVDFFCEGNLIGSFPFQIKK